MFEVRSAADRQHTEDDARDNTMTQTDCIQWNRMLARSRSPLAWYDEHDPCDNRHPEQQHAHVQHQQREADDMATRHDPAEETWRDRLTNAPPPQQITVTRGRGTAVSCAWVYHEFDGSWLVGYYDPDGNWQGDGAYPDRETAAARVHWLNGGG